MRDPLKKVNLGTGIDTAAQDAITVLNQSSSRLLRLPAELRNTIFKHALSGFEIRMSYSREVYRQVAAYYKPIDDPKAPWLPATDLTPISATCRQLYAETRKLLFTLDNRFSGQTGWCVEVFMDRLSEEQRRLIEVGKRSASYSRTGEGLFSLPLRR